MKQPWLFIVLETFIPFVNRFPGTVELQLPRHRLIQQSVIGTFISVNVKKIIIFLFDEFLFLFHRKSFFQSCSSYNLRIEFPMIFEKRMRTDDQTYHVPYFKLSIFVNYCVSAIRISCTVSMFVKYQFHLTLKYQLNKIKLKIKDRIRSKSKLSSIYVYYLNSAHLRLARRVLCKLCFRT